MRFELKESLMDSGALGIFAKYYGDRKYLLIYLGLGVRTYELEVSWRATPKKK